MTLPSKPKRQSEKLHERANLLNGAADSLAGFIEDHASVMRPADYHEATIQIKECRKTAGTLIRRARLLAARNL